MTVRTLPTPVPRPFKTKRLDLRSAAAIVSRVTLPPRALKPAMSHEYVQHALALFGSGRDFLVFDTETTDKMEATHGPGLNHPAGTHTGRVMQMAARRYRWDRNTNQVFLVGQMNVLINDPDIKALGDEANPVTGGAGCCLHQRAFETHHIRIADLRKKGVSPAQAWTQFMQLASGAVLVGQNLIGFDIPFVNRDLARLGIRGELDPRMAIDTLIIARHLWDLRSYKLRDLATFLGVKTDPSLDHDALGDIDTTWQVWLAMQDGLRRYQARFIVGQPDQYKRALGGLGEGWSPSR